MVMLPLKCQLVHLCPLLLFQAVSRTEEKVDRLLESQDDRLVEEALADVVDFPIQDGLTLLEENLKTKSSWYVLLLLLLDFL